MPTIILTYERSEALSTYQGYSLKVTADADSADGTTSVSPKIFVYQRSAAPAPGSGETPDDRFICIADPVDLEEFPEDAPILDEAAEVLPIPYFRSNVVELYFRSVADRERVATQIDEDVRGLVDALKKMADYGDTETRTYS